jgi:hypothetical protein
MQPNGHVTRESLLQLAHERVCELIIEPGAADER